MADISKNDSRNLAHRRYRWPWFVLAGLLAAIALAVLWLSFEVERTRRMRDWNSSAPAGQQH